MRPDQLNVFDFDGTLVNVNSFREINKHLILILLKKIQIIQFIKILSYYVVRRLKLISHLLFKKHMVAIFEESLSENEKTNIAQKIFEKNINHIIYDNMKKSKNIVLSTAAPHAYISRINFNINSIIYICSLHPTLNLPDQSNFGKGKVQNIEWYFKNHKISIINFYTDSYDDQSLIDISLNVFLVKKGIPFKIK